MVRSPLTSLRYVTAILLVLTTISSFVYDVVYQANSIGFDGPLAWFHQYTFGLNKIALAGLFSTMLIFDFEIKSDVGNRIVHAGSAVAILLSLAGMGFLIREYFFLHAGNNSFWYLKALSLMYLFQWVYILSSVVIFLATKTRTSTIGAKE